MSNEFIDDETSKKWSRGRKKKMDLNVNINEQLLDQLTARDIIELQDYLLQRMIYWMTMAESTKFASAFNGAMQLLINLYQPQQPQQEQQETTTTTTSTPMPTFTNPFDALVFRFFSNIADRIADRILENPELRKQLEEIIKGSVSSTIQQLAKKQPEQ